MNKESMVSVSGCMCDTHCVCVCVCVQERRSTLRLAKEKREE